MEKQPIPTAKFAPTPDTARRALQTANRISRMVDADAARVAALAEELRAYWPQWPR